RKSVLGIAGLAFAGGLAAGPLNHDTALAPSAAGVMPAAVAVQAADKADKADKPGVDEGKLIPHGVQGE
ncbi:hypothetical protein ACLQ2V_28215, partial [Micromonospora sp. DT233]